VLVTTDTQWACLSDPALFFPRMQGYVGFASRMPGRRTPAVGEVYYAHLVLSHPNNNCAGGSATYIEFAPPPNTQLAVSADNPLFCFWRRHDSWSGINSIGTLYNMAGNCNQNPSVGTYGGYNLRPINTSDPVWIVPNYSYMEFLIPLRSFAPLNGQTARGTLNPDVGVVAHATAPVYVNNDVIFRDSFQWMNLYLDICIPNTNFC
jgi:hypothetical protein